MGIKEQTEAKMTSAIEHLKNELHSLRTGRANPAMVQGVKVNVYGSEMRLQDLASITAPEARQLLITPYDGSSTQSIAKAIQDANLGFMPNTEGHQIRIKIPPMDDALRKKMIKLCHDYGEQTKIVIRGERQNGNKTVRKQKADGEISEDLVNKMEKEIQTLTDKYCKLVDELCSAKEKEISVI
jgi:ribosome recycling factor